MYMDERTAKASAYIMKCRRRNQRKAARRYKALQQLTRGAYYCALVWCLCTAAGALEAIL